MNEDRLLTREETAKLLGVSNNLLAKWATLGKGPSYIKLGSGPKSHTRYSRQAITDFINQMTNVMENK
jgi:predicted DNA-binding transcriptional regulator AlpA